MTHCFICGRAQRRWRAPYVVLINGAFAHFRCWLFARSLAVTES